MNGEKLLLELPAWPTHERKCDRYAVDSRATPPEDKCLFHREDKPLISARDIHLIAARPKAGKSTFAWALVQAAANGSCLGFKAEQQFRSLIIDTEMSEFDVARKARGLEAAGISIHGEPNDTVRVLRLRRPNKDDCDAAKMPVHEWRFQILEDALDAQRYDLVVIDGVHDFCKDVMDNNDSVEASRRLQALAEQYDCAVLCIIHLNPKGSGETRGHLGSQLQRDCSDFFRLERRTDAAGTQYVHVEHEVESRHQQVPPIDFVFGDDGEALPFCPVNPVASEADRLRDDLSAVFDKHVEASSAELREALANEGESRATGFRRVQRAVDLGIITPTRKGWYSLSCVAEFNGTQNDYDDEI